MRTLLEIIDPEDLLALIAKKNVQQGRQLQKSGAVQTITYDPGEKVLSALVVEGDDSYSAKLLADGDELLFRCTCPESRKRPCQHVVALMLERVAQQEQVSLQTAGETEADDELDEEFFTTEPAAPSLEERSAQLSARLVEDYREYLNAFTLPALRSLAERRGVAVSGARRDPILDTLAEALSQAENTERAVESLSPEDRLALDVLFIVFSVDLTNHPRELERMVERLFRQRGVKRTAADSLKALAEAGLMAYESTEARLPLSLFYYLPADPALVGSSETLEQAAPGQQLELQNAPPVQSLARLAVHLLLLAQARVLKAGPAYTSSIWGGWPEGPEEKSRLDRFSNARDKTPLYPQPSFLAQETLLRLKEELEQPEEKLDYLGRLLAAAGLLRITQERLLEVQQEPFAQFLALPPHLQVRLLFYEAARLADWSELDLLFRKKELALYRRAFGGGYYLQLLKERAALRQFLLHCLRLLPEGSWTPVDNILRLFHSLALDYSFPFSNPATWAEINGKKVDTRDYAAWKDTYGRFYTAVLLGPACWLGLCDLALEKGQPAALRLTPFGAFATGQRRQFESPASGERPSRLALLPDLVVEMDPGLASPRILSLAPILGELQPPAPGGKLRYRLSPRGARRAFSLGWTLERMLETLQEAAGLDGLPEEYSRRLSLWWKNFGRLQLYENLALVELADDYALDELLVSTRLSAHLLYIFNRRLVAVRPEGVPDLIASFEAGGYTPMVVTQEHEDARGADPQGG